HRTLLLPVILAVLSGQLTAQEGETRPAYTYPPALIAEMRQLQNEALASDYAYVQLAHLCNNIGPRLSGSPQANHAAQYVAGEMRRLGLNVELEKVMVPHWVRGI